ncbi:MAG: formyltransferase family protein [Planctomycetota bacterium]|jgi:hypothetical protein
MLKCVFIGRKNIFNEFLTDWLTIHTNLQAIIWGDRNRDTWTWRYKWLKRTIKRCGLIGTIDRILFRRWAFRSEEMRAGWRRLRDDIKKTLPTVGNYNNIEQVYADSINTTEIEIFLKHIEPDLIFANCISELVSERICKIPKHGLYVYHEGLTPEYRGQHAFFWALANNEDDKIGYTLLRANEKYDAGDVYAQGITNLDPLATSLGYTSHYALFEGLDDVERFLRELEQGTSKPIDTSGRKEACYSYFPLSQMFRIWRRRRARGLTVNPTSVIKRSDSDMGSDP